MSIEDNMFEARQDLLENPTVEKARAYHRKYRPPEMQNFHDEGLLGGVHKARLQLGIGVEESLEWLSAHGMSPDIPDEFLQAAAERHHE